MASFDKHREMWRRKWMDNGRYARLQSGIWQSVPEMRVLADFARVPDDLLTSRDGESESEYEHRASACLEVAQGRPALQHFLCERFVTRLDSSDAADRSSLERRMLLLYLLATGKTRLSLRERIAPPFSGRSIFWQPLLQIVPPYVEREIGKFLCTVGFVDAGAFFWTSASKREACALHSPARHA